jgi:hypothetical protein
MARNTSASSHRITVLLRNVLPGSSTSHKHSASRSVNYIILYRFFVCPLVSYGRTFCACVERVCNLSNTRVQFVPRIEHVTSPSRRTAYWCAGRYCSLLLLKVTPNYGNKHHAKENNIQYSIFKQYSLMFILYLAVTSLFKLFIHIFSIDIRQSFHERLSKNLYRIQICR